MNLQTSIETLVNINNNGSDYTQVYAILDGDMKLASQVSSDWCLRGLRQKRARPKGPFLAAKAKGYIAPEYPTDAWYQLDVWLRARSVYAKYYVRDVGTIFERRGVGLYHTTVGSAEGCIEAAMLERTIHQYPQVSCIWRELVRNGVEPHKALCCAASYLQSMYTILEFGWRQAPSTRPNSDMFPIPSFQSANFGDEVEAWLAARGGDSEKSFFDKGCYDPLKMFFSRGSSYEDGDGYHLDFDTRPIPGKFEVEKCVALLG